MNIRYFYIHRKHRDLPYIRVYLKSDPWIKLTIKQERKMMLLLSSTVSNYIKIWRYVRGTGLLTISIIIKFTIVRHVCSIIILTNLLLSKYVLIYHCDSYLRKIFPSKNTITIIHCFMRYLICAYHINFQWTFVISVKINMLSETEHTE